MTGLGAKTVSSAAAAGLLGAFATTADADIRFRDLSDSLSVPHSYTGGWEHFVGGGVAVFDCDANGFPDLYAAGGETPARLFINQTANPGDDPVFSAEHGETLAVTGVTGAYPLDIDGDGILDLFVMRAGPNAVFRGLGDCRFREASDDWNIPQGNAWTTAFSATWEPDRGRPTLAVGNYVDRDDPEGPFGTCSPHQLLRPSGDTFRAPEQITPGHCTLSMLFFDWSGGGQQDLWISNDRHYYVRDGQEQLFRITPKLRAFGPDDGWQPHLLWGMGIAARDINGDARPEVAVTSMADQYFFERMPDVDGPAYAQNAFQRGTTAHRPHTGDEGRPSTGWHAAFGDVDNDGRDDLFIAKGNVEQMPGLAMKDPDNLLVQGPDGHFSEMGASAGVASTEKSRGAALTDLNRDGLLDLVVVQRGAPMKLYRNVTENTGHWLKLRLKQAAGNVDAVGARVEIETGNGSRYREVLVGGGHAGGEAGYLHFGLGAAEAARLRVRWPDGSLSEWAEAPADQHLTVTRSDGSEIELAGE